MPCGGVAWLNAPPVASAPYFGASEYWNLTVVGEPFGLTVAVKLAVLELTVGGGALIPVGLAPALSPEIGGSSRLKYVDCPGWIAGEKWTMPLLASVETFENQLVGPS
jgi:hypothetical protein